MALLDMKLQGFEKQVALALEDFQGDARHKMFVDAAKEVFKETDEGNAAATGARVKSTRVVDGVRDAPIEAVRIGGTVVFNWSPITPAVEEVYARLVRMSPVGGAGDPHPGLFKASNIVLINDVEVSIPFQLNPGDVVKFTNLQPYARRIETGWSKQAPNGIYETVAAITQKTLRQFARVTFAYEHYVGRGAGGPKTRYGGAGTHSQDERYPTITIAEK